MICFVGRTNRLFTLSLELQNPFEVVFKTFVGKSGIVFERVSHEFEGVIITLEDFL